MTTWITVCETCKRPEAAEAPPDLDFGSATSPVVSAPTHGARLAALLEDVLAAEPGPAQAPVRLRRHACLMGCAAACNVAIQADGKIAYTLGRFAPEPATARAVVDFAREHALSATGQVPYRRWPQAVKGHFVTRHPPLP